MGPAILLLFTFANVHAVLRRVGWLPSQKKKTHSLFPDAFVREKGVKHQQIYEYLLKRLARAIEDVVHAYSILNYNLSFILLAHCISESRLILNF